MVSSLSNRNIYILFFSWVNQNAYVKSTPSHQNTNAKHSEEIMNVLINFIKTFKDKLKKILNSIQPPWKLPKGSRKSLIVHSMSFSHHVNDPHTKP